MYSPFQAVYGHDRTFVKRMTLREYLQEVDDEERDLRGEAPRGRRRPSRSGNGSANSSTDETASPPQYELRRAALSSKDPSVVFSSKYPMYDRLGRELCVLYQMQDMAVEQEYQRLQREGEACRRSGVRLSAELKLDTTSSRVTATVAATGTVGSGQTYRAYDDVDVTVSTMSRASSFARSRPVSARPSEFSIYRDSAKPPLMLAARASNAVAEANQQNTANASAPGWAGGAKKKVWSMPATPTAATTVIDAGKLDVVAYPIAVTAHPFDGRGYSQPLPSRAHGDPGDKENSMPVGSRAAAPPQPMGLRLHKLVDEDRGGRNDESRSRSRHHSRSQKRSRDPSHIRGSDGGRGGSARLSRVRFADEEQEAVHALEKPAGREFPELKSPKHDVAASEDVGDEVIPPGVAPIADNHPLQPQPPGAPPLPPQERSNQDASAVGLADPVRFTMARDSTAARITKQLFRCTAGAMGRGTTTLTHAHPIPSSAYGLESTTIPASSVFADVEKNFAACGALSNSSAETTAKATPELRCGRIIQLGNRWFQLTTFFPVAEVYGVVEVDPPSTDAGAEAKKQSDEAVLTAYEDQPPTNCADKTNDGAKEREHVGVEEQAVSPVERERSHSPPPPPSTSPATAASGSEDGANGECPGTPVAEPTRWLPPAKDAAHCHHLLYRWRNRHYPYSGNEARHAAVGLGLCAPEVCVSGYAFNDGGGLTLLTLPKGYRAAPLSGLPLAAPSYRTLLKLVLRVLSAMVARRTVHGGLASLGEIFTAFPDSTNDTPAATAAAPPLVLPVHWERAVDFSMFIDRNAGRTIPYDSEDGSERPLITLGKDLSTVLQCFLEHKQAAELTSEQYVLLQKLVVMASEPTQVANYLVQIKNLMSALQSDLPSLRQAYDAAVVFYEG